MALSCLHVKQLSRVVYRYGSAGEWYGNVVLGSDGLVHAYDHPNERRWSLSGESLHFLNDAGAVSSILRYFPLAHSFFQDGGSGLRLVPVLALQNAAASKHTSRLIVNTIPKAGTYLVDAVLKRLGLSSLGLHLGDLVLHDNRAVRPHDIHWNPHERLVECSASAIATVMEAGEYAVGHLCDPDEIEKVANNGVHIIQCVRDLRDVLVSLWTFKRSKVKPSDHADLLWRKFDGESGFLAFLVYYVDRDIVHLRSTAQAISARSGPILRFEDLCFGSLPASATKGLDAIEPGLGSAFANLLPKVVDVQTSTLNQPHADHRTIWSTAVEEFFQASGLGEANVALGYSTR